MEQKAFVFDYEGFRALLLPTLEAALLTESSDELIRFVERFHGRLKDPYEGRPLTSDWRDLVDLGDPHQLGDVALTLFYDPSDDRGLGAAWQQTAELLEVVGASLGYSPVLGRPIGPPANRFDPGKMGSYFMSPVEAVAARDALRSSCGAAVAERLIPFLDEVVAQGRGSYATF